MNKNSLMLASSVPLANGNLSPYLPPMKIALLGYGKMGRTIDTLATAAGDEIVLRVGSANTADLTADKLRRADVAIDFSLPTTAFANVSAGLRAGVPVVCGTTAWLDRLEEAKQLCAAQKGAFLYASNFSIGVNIFFAVNRYLAGLMREQPQYAVRVEETHHTAKLDAPSGTAKTLAEALPPGTPITSHRIDPAPGTHAVSYQSEVDSIEITHTAHSREGFARGALQAAHWLVGKEGFFGMGDVLGLRTAD